MIRRIKKSFKHFTVELEYWPINSYPSHGPQLTADKVNTRLYPGSRVWRRFECVCFGEILDLRKLNSMGPRCVMCRRLWIYTRWGASHSDLTIYKDGSDGTPEAA